MCVNDNIVILWIGNEAEVKPEKKDWGGEIRTRWGGYNAMFISLVPYIKVVPIFKVLFFFF